MLELTIKIMFALCAFMFILLIFAHKKITSKIKDNVKVANYVAIIAFSLTIYICCAVIITFFIPEFKYKILMLLFAFSPFIIGKFATYQKIKLYCLLQSVIMIVSVAVAYLK